VPGAVFLFTLALVLAQQNPPSPPESTFHSSSNLVLVPVVALKNGLLDRTLKRDDVQVVDNEHPVSITTFDSGAQFSTRPLAL